MRSHDVFAPQQLGAGQRRVSAPVAWMCARTFLMLLSSDPADAVPVVAQAVLAEGLELEVSVHLCEVSNEERTLLGGVSHAHLCAVLFAGCV